ncbi:uncharacterized protein [Parasteatoda tepidariorum]|uniref:uncharacterized protein isoform X3 n=1 Tax=Parasteatoda tepidariorum TaxID=114398 RepID=UPI001C71FACF|nr:uncharacterized protein LOC107451441 isoform X3 [Parasteatoda tepidariorum]
MAYVNVAEWNPEHVVDWLRGLEDEIQPYTQFFVNKKVNGCQLLTLAKDDLANLNMTKIGHQELVLEAVEQLRQLHYNLTSETLQSLALKLGCKAQSLFNDLKRVCQDYANTGKKERVSVETLSAVSDLINLVKSLISWLDRYPFVGQDSYVEVRKIILKLSIELASTAQRDQFAENPHGTIKEICSKLTEQSDKIVQDFNDSLIIQPASLEVAKIKRKVDDDVGIHINSLYTGIHIIESIKFQSPAYRSGKVEEGDEIIQVNYQTVVGWQVKNIICSMKEHPSEVHLTLKKRPRHPNVLGQVITLWPYRIPSKKTAFRKFKFSRKDIRELCPKSPGNRGESNSVSEVNGTLASEKERLLATNKPRSRLRRRATVTGVSPTALQPPVSLEELIGNNSKRKESVLRTISYDPNKTIDIEDNVFKRETQSCSGPDEKDNLQLPENTPQASNDKDSKSATSTFLRPPQEKFMTGHLKRQEALKNSETVARAGVAVAVQPNGPSCAPPKPPLRVVTQSQNDANTVPEVPPSGSQSPKQKFADWVNRQKKKPEGGLLQHALTLFSPDSNSQTCSSPTPKDGGSPKSPKLLSGSPKLKKAAGNLFQFPFREGRPSLSELRSLKKSANSKAFSERVNSSQNDAPPITSPKQNPPPKRNPNQFKKPGLNNNIPIPVKNSKLPSDVNGGIISHKQSSKITDSYIHPKSINYAKIPQYPCEMHESKIVSLKGKSNRNTINSQKQLPHATSQPTRNNLHYQRARQMSKAANQDSSSLMRNSKISSAAYYSPSGRSLSFNNIAMSSEDDSSSDEYEIYAELSNAHVSAVRQQNPPQNLPYMGNDTDSTFVKQVAEMYNMLSQRQQFLQTQANRGYRGPMNATDKAIIDELAMRMYHALQMNHMQTQNAYHNTPHNMPPQYPPVKMPHNPMHYQNGNCEVNSRLQSEHFQQMHVPTKLQAHQYNLGTSAPEKPVHEHPVDLPPSGCLPSRTVNNVFKSATSQEIHNLYTSQLVSRSSSGNVTENGRCSEHPDECIERDHLYETIPFQKPHDKNCDSGDVFQQEEKSYLYPAEKELERGIPSKDRNHFLSDNAPENIALARPNPNFVRENMFCPIKENTLNADQVTNSAFRQINASKNEQNQIQTDKISSEINGPGTIFDKNVQPAISSLLINIPKPPSEVYPAIKKSSSSQTDSEFCDSVIAEDDSDGISPKIIDETCINGDESFTTALNCTSNSISDSLGYSSSSSLSSNSSGSTISSSGSCYYYVETQIKPQFTIKFPSVTSENGEEVPLIDLRSPTLPTMGVSMLNKKLSPSNSGSEHGSNSGSRASPNIPVETEMMKPPRIVTDVEHTF